MKYLIKNINTFPNDLYTQIYDNLNHNKKEKIDKCINDESRKRMLLGEYLLNNLFKDNYDINYQNEKTIINNFGKPYIENRNIFFNISHSGNYVIAVISNKEIGVDIQIIKDTNVNVLHQFATNNETNYILSAHNKNEIKNRLFKIYTLKEAYIKMKGTNMNEIKNIEFNIMKNRIICSDTNVKVSTLNNKIEGYCISICEKK